MFSHINGILASRPFIQLYGSQKVPGINFELFILTCYLQIYLIAFKVGSSCTHALAPTPPPFLEILLEVPFESFPKFGRRVGFDVFNRVESVTFKTHFDLGVKPLAKGCSIVTVYCTNEDSL